MSTDLELAYNALSGKQAAYDLLWRYYDGDHPLKYSTQRLREIFKHLNVSFVENWCAVVVDSAIERVNIAGFVVAGNEPAQDQLNADFAATELTLDSDDAHLAALVCGEAFVLIWPNEAGEPEAYYNDPRMCHVQYDADNPREKRWAAKWWIAEDGRYRLVLYYTDTIEYYISTGKADSVRDATSFEIGRAHV